VGGGFHDDHLLALLRSTSMAWLPGSTAAITATGPGRVARSAR
jgi:hypothetical protein